MFKIRFNVWIEVLLDFCYFRCKVEDEDLTLENLNMKMNLIMMRKLETNIINGKSQTDIGEILL